MNGFARQNPTQNKSRHGQSKAQGSLSFQGPFPSFLQPDEFVFSVALRLYFDESHHSIDPYSLGNFSCFFVEKFLSFGESRQESRVFKTRICRLSFSRPRHKRKTTTLSCYEDAGLHVRSTIKHEIFIYIFIHYNSYITHTHISTQTSTHNYTQSYLLSRPSSLIYPSIVVATYVKIKLLLFK